MATRGRRYLSVHFVCAGVFQRIYLSRAGDAYEGRCPRCLQPVHVAIDPEEGSDARLFTVDCGKR